MSLTTQVAREVGREAPDEARLARLQAELDETRAEQDEFTPDAVRGAPGPEGAAGAGSDGCVRRRHKPARCRPSAAVVEFAVSEAKTFVFVVRPRGRAKTSKQGDPAVTVTVHVLDVKAVDLAAKVAQFRGFISKKDAGVPGAARELYDLLLKPVEAIWPASRAW